MEWILTSVAADFVTDTQTGPPALGTAEAGSVNSFQPAATRAFVAMTVPRAGRRFHVSESVQPHFAVRIAMLSAADPVLQRRSFADEAVPAGVLKRSSARRAAEPSTDRRDEVANRVAGSEASM